MTDITYVAINEGGDANVGEIPLQGVREGPGPNTGCRKPPIVDGRVTVLTFTTTKS